MIPDLNRLIHSMCGKGDRLILKVLRSYSSAPSSRLSTTGPILPADSKLGVRSERASVGGGGADRRGWSALKHFPFPRQSSSPRWH